MKQSDDKIRIFGPDEDMNRSEPDESIEETAAQLAGAYHSIPIPPGLRCRVEQTIRDTRAEETSARITEIPARDADTSACDTDTHARDAGIPERDADTHARITEIPARDTEIPTRDTDTSACNAGIPAQHSRTPARRFLWLRRSAQTAAAALLAVGILANCSPQTAYAMEQIPILGAIARVVTFRTYEKEEGNTEAKVEIPQIAGSEGSSLAPAADQVNRSAQEYTEQLIRQFEAEVSQDGQETPHALYSGYRVLVDNDQLFTLSIETTETMASGAQSVRLYTIDKAAGRVLSLSDLFPAGTDYTARLTDAAKEQMRRNMEQDDSLSYFLDSGDPADFTAIPADQDFYIRDNGCLVLVFDEYEVAPGYMGIVELELPASVYQWEGSPSA